MARADVVQLMENGKKKYVKTHYGAIDGMTYNIREGEDLNNIREPGVYHTTMDARARTMLNCPTDRAFKLEVAVASDHAFVYQTLTTWITGTVYVRTYYGYGKEWRAWQPIGLPFTNWQRLQLFGGAQKGKYDQNGIFIRKVNGVPFVHCDGIMAGTKLRNVTVARLPEGFRPARVIHFDLIEFYGSPVKQHTLQMSAYPGGDIKVRATTHGGLEFSGAPVPLI